jgi:hypothetical protein
MPKLFDFSSSEAGTSKQAGLIIMEDHFVEERRTPPEAFLSFVAVIKNRALSAVCTDLFSFVLFALRPSQLRQTASFAVYMFSKSSARSCQPSRTLTEPCQQWGSG